MCKYSFHAFLWRNGWMLQYFIFILMRRYIIINNRLKNAYQNIVCITSQLKISRQAYFSLDLSIIICSDLYVRSLKCTRHHFYSSIKEDQKTKEKIITKYIQSDQDHQGWGLKRQTKWYRFAFKINFLYRV